METTTLGKTGLKVSRIGVGLSEIGSLALESAQQVQEVLAAALDSGINFLDTAACYGNSEELVGLAVSSSRSQFILATKCGHVTGGYEGTPWTAQTIKDSIDRSLRRMRTDYVDLVQLHSCGVDILEKGEAIEALLKAKQAGLTRFVGYSGDNDSARWAVESGHFDTLQTSFNLVDQQARARLFPLVEGKGMGLIAKRPIANGTWGAAQSPSAYAEAYFQRAQVMAGVGAIPGAPADRILLALGFVLAHREIDTAIVGTRNPAHMSSNLRMVERRASVSTKVVEELHRRFDQMGQEWVQKG